MAGGPDGSWLGGRLRDARDRMQVRVRSALRALDARPAARIALGLGLVMVLPALAALARADAAAAETATRLALSFAALAWLGRGLRLAWERAFGASRFAVWREPAWDGLVGWLAATVLLLVLSLVWKRGIAGHAPLGALFAGLWLVLAAGLSLPRSLRRSAVPPLRTFGRLALVLAAFALLAGDHLGVHRPYSSDPEQHVAWLTQIGLYGFVPDLYWQTDAPITYPLGFASLAHALGALGGLTATECIALLPPFVSVLFVHLVVVAARDLAGGPRGCVTSGLAFLCFLALASAFDSGQFSGWNVYEGTGRLAAGALHVVPAMAGLAVAAGATRLRAPGRPGAAASGGLLVFAALVTTALVCVLNPAHLPLQGVLWAVVLAAAAWRAPRPHPAGAGRALGIGAGLGGALALALLVADGATARRLPGVDPFEIDPALARVEAEFDGAFTGRTCPRASCVAAAALRPAALAGLVMPARVLVEGPVRALLQPAYDRFHTPMLRGPRSFPDLTGTGLAPLHGLARPAAIALPWILALWWWRSGERSAALPRALAGLLGAATLDGWVRAALRVWVDPDDAALRLLPDYANRASAVWLAQTFWPLLVTGLVLRVRGRRVLLACGLVLAVVLASAQWELAGRRSELARLRAGPDARDVSDLRALEAAHVPPGDHYLVSSHVAVSNRERWLVSIDPSSVLYAQAARPALFLYHLSSGARVSAADFEATCRAVRSGQRGDGGAPAPLIERYRARWLALLARDELAARIAFGGRRFCGVRLDALFPAARLAGTRGRVALFRLW